MGRWGSGLFQGDMDLDLSSDLASELGLYELQDEAQAEAKAAGEPEEVYERISYHIYGPCCSNPELVRDYLDAGALEDLINEKEAKILTPSVYDGPVYTYVLLGACAMTLGCHLPDSFLSMLKLLYTEAGLFRDGREQMNKALFGPAGFENGVPYNFESKGLVETANTMSEGNRDSDEDEYYRNDGPSMIIKELRGKHNNPNSCGGCGVKAGEEGTVLLRCGQCKDRKYCSLDCQKQSWNVHKKVCKPVQ